MAILAASGGHPVLITLAIVAAVLLLAALRAGTWVRRERVLRRVGLDLHVADDGRTDGDSRQIRP